MSKFMTVKETTLTAIPFLLCSGASIVLFVLVYVDIFQVSFSNLESTRQHDSDNIYISNELINNQNLDNLDILIVGGSSIREAFSHSVELNNFTTKLCSRPVITFNAGGSSQPLVDSLAIAEVVQRYRQTSPTVIIVGLTEYRLSHKWDSYKDIIKQQKVALDTPRNTLLDIPRDTLKQLSSLDKMITWLSGRITRFQRIFNFLRQARLKTNKPIRKSENRSHYENGRFSKKTILRQVIGSYEFRQAAFQKFGEKNANIFSRAFENIKSQSNNNQGTKIVYIITPSASILEGFSSTNQHLWGKIIKNLSQHAEVIDLRSIINWNNQDFIDLQHVTSNGRRRLEQAIISSPTMKKALCPK